MQPHAEPRPTTKSLTNLPILPLLVLLLAIVWAQPATAQTWTTLPGAAMDVGANVNGDVWVIGTNPVPGGYTIWRWVNGNFQNIPGGAVRISVDTDGTAWVVNNTNNIFHSGANGQWTMAPGGATDIGVGANGDVWIIGANRTGNDYDIWHAVFAPGTRNVSSWQNVAGGAVRIAVGPDGTPWVVNSGGNIFQRQGNAWTQLPGAAKDITLGPDGEAYVVGASPSGTGGSAVYRWQGSNWTQVGVMGANVAAGPAGTIYVTQDSTAQYAIVNNAASPFAANATTASTSSNTPAGLTAFEFCWRNTHGRGAGTPLSTKSSDCPAGTVKDPTGLLCYPPCQQGYSMVGPVCYHDCPQGWSGTGVSCFKPAGYDRSGNTYPWQGSDGISDSGMFSRCNAANSQGCEKLGAIVYPKCKSGYHARGSDAFACDPDNNTCPSGMTDSGAMCTKDSYGNTAGQVLGCASGLEKSGLLCYSSCGANSDGVGPECWDHCPSSFVQCGAGCAKDTTACAAAIQDQVMSVLVAAATIASEVLTAGAAAGGIEAGKTAKMAGTDAADMVGKLKLGDAVKAFPQNGLNKAKVSDVVVAAFKPTKLTITTKVVGAASDAATMIDTMVGISNDPTLTPDQKNWQIAQAVLQTTSLVDPTGIAGVVAAYTKPLCSVLTETANNDLGLDVDGAYREKVRMEFLGNK
jgi:hypothetical protein